MLLSQILSGIDTETKDYPEVEITSVELNSQQVKEGTLFIALSGKNSDGKKYIPDALQRGARVVLYDGEYSPLQDKKNVVFIKTKGDMRKNISIASRNFYKPIPHYISAVTGTNGKTSIADFTRQIMTKLGYSSASIGTIGVVSEVADNIETLTTPDSVTLHKILRQLAQKGTEYVSLEASSIGIEQYRMDGVGIKVAGFTNLTEDHLDYHLNMENYFNAKKILFSRVLEKNGTAVLNADIPQYEELADICQKRGIRVLSYGYKGKDLQVIKRKAYNSGQSVDVKICGQEHHIELPLIGEFQMMNVLCAMGMIIALHGFSGKMLDYIPHIKGAAGRLDLVGRTANGASVYVDYAHTPDALENVLKTMRHHTENNLWVIFGCGGDRDKLKRPIMGKIAQELADEVVVTDDNPRTENAAEIRRQVISQCPKAVEIGDRIEAINSTISKLKAGDMLVIAGKGHENGQKIGNQVIPMNDIEEAAKALKNTH